MIFDLLLLLLLTLLLRSRCSPLPTNCHYTLSTPPSLSSDSQLHTFSLYSSVHGCVSPLNASLSIGPPFRLRILPSNASASPFVVPSSFLSSSDCSSLLPAAGSSVHFSRVGEPFTVSIVSTDISLVTFSDVIWDLSLQYISFNVTLSNDTLRVFGLGERDGDLWLKEPKSSYSIFNKNWHVVEPGLNLYGSHPFLFSVLKSEKNENENENENENFFSSVGFFLFSSNAMQVDYDFSSSSSSSSPTLRYQLTGGIIDSFFLLAQTSSSTLSCYHHLIGHPLPPPAWSLGFHQCKYGYRTTSKLREVLQGYENSNIPIESLWSDIDVYDSGRTFTVDESRFGELKEFVEEELQGNGRRYVVIIDPGMWVNENYDPWIEGKELGVFIRNGTNSNIDNDDFFPGKMFAGEVNFPDFESENSSEWWRRQLSSFHSILPFDGVWLDQNELTNFCDGWCNPSEAVPNKWDQPPFVPGTVGDMMTHMSISMSALQKEGANRHYDVHNLYPVEEAIATQSALSSILTSSPAPSRFAVSRSSWIGLGATGTGHWLGDNNGTWSDLRESIIGIMSFNFFGIPLVGADVGGFYLQTPEELMIRWVQLGAYYPFFRDHAHKSVEHQELYSFGERVTNVSRNAIRNRLALISFLRTSFYEMSIPRISKMVMQPIWMVLESHSDSVLSDDVYGIQDSFFWSDVLLVAPIVEQGSSHRSVYLDPSLRWYEFSSGEEIVAASNNNNHNVENRLDDVTPAPAFQRGGTIIPLHMLATTTTSTTTVYDALSSDVSLRIGLDSDERATGSFFYDIIDDSKIFSSFVSFDLSTVLNPNRLDSECDSFTRLTAHLASSSSSGVLSFGDDLGSPHPTSWPVLSDLSLLGVANDRQLLHVHFAPAGVRRWNWESDDARNGFEVNSFTQTENSVHIAFRSSELDSKYRQLGRTVMSDFLQEDEETSLLWSIELCFEVMPEAEIEIILVVSIFVVVVLCVMFILYLSVLCTSERLWKKRHHSDEKNSSSNPAWYESVNERRLLADD